MIMKTFPHPSGKRNSHKCIWTWYQNFHMHESKTRWNQRGREVHSHRWIFNTSSLKLAVTPDPKNQHIKDSDIIASLSLWTSVEHRASDSRIYLLSYRHGKTYRAQSMVHWDRPYVGPKNASINFRRLNTRRGILLSCEHGPSRLEINNNNKIEKFPNIQKWCNPDLTKTQIKDETTQEHY